MPRSQLVGLLFDAWDDLDRVLAGLDERTALAAGPGESSFAWTVAHLANQLDAWTNVRFQGLPPHPLISQTRFRIGGSGLAGDWPAIRAAALAVRESARAYVEGLADGDLDLTVSYDGSLAHLRERGLNLRYALLRTIAHHYFHIGEIAAKRAGLGHSPGDYPGLLTNSL
ncbi:MAG: DinB family protein [Dehalococcoidia bacterium]|nr:DinB family protein [Dehalococcoidia bacterium]